MVRFTPAALVAALVLTAGCVGMVPGSGDPSPSPVTSGVSSPAGSVAEPAASDSLLGGNLGSLSAGEAGTIAVSGTGTVSVEPDLALVRVTVRAEAESADDARGQVATDVERMRDALRDFGVADDAVRTTYYSVSPRYDHSGERSAVVGYVATHAYEIRSAVDEAGSVVDTAVGNGADQVSGVQFTLTDETRQDLRTQALTDAVTDARADADAIAAATGVSVTGLHSASTSQPVVVPYAARAEVAADGAPTTFDTGPVTVSAHVTVVYTID